MTTLLLLLLGFVPVVFVDPPLKDLVEAVEADLGRVAAETACAKPWSCSLPLVGEGCSVTMRLTVEELPRSAEDDDMTDEAPDTELLREGRCPALEVESAQDMETVAAL